MPIALVINEYVQELENKLVEELQKQMPKKIISSMIILELEGKEVVIGNFGKVIEKAT